MPHAVVLRSTAGAIRILVTNADVVRRWILGLRVV